MKIKVLCTLGPPSLDLTVIRAFERTNVSQLLEEDRVHLGALD